MNNWDTIVDSFSFENYGELLALVSNSVIASVALGIMGGFISVFVMLRRMAFAVHGIAEISFSGAAIALFFGFDVVMGSIMGAIASAMLIGWLGLRDRDTSAVTGVLMPFGLGVGILFLSLYPGRTANKFGLLTGQVVAVDQLQSTALVIAAVVVVVSLLVMWRPLLFSSVDPELAQARGVKTNTLSIVFMLLLGVTVAMSVQVVGALLVLALVVVPAAAALKVTANPVGVVSLSVIFAVLASTGGLLLSLGGRVPVSPYVTTISFLIYLICLVIGRGRRTRREHQLSQRPGNGGAEDGQLRNGALAAATLQGERV
ncbi:metal ABC transporter permease [Micrococcoides hystricis]|uniref:Metal ABC transporter permease n=1 Tax=Micrococcoides hystricis TaxID=1572761 RepID=A0ABV6PBR2_9MICC